MDNLLKKLIKEILLNEGSAQLGAAYEALIQGKLNVAGIGVPGRKGAGSGHGADVVMSYGGVSAGVEAKTSGAADIGQANVVYDGSTFSWSNPNQTTDSFDEFDVLSAINVPAVKRACNRFLRLAKASAFPARVDRELYDSYSDSLELAVVPIDSSVILSHYSGKGAESSSYIQIGRTEAGKQLVGSGKGLYILNDDPFSLAELGVPQFDVPSVKARVRLKSGGGRPLTTVSLNVAVKISSFPDSPINLENSKHLATIKQYLVGQKAK